jgi:hypothetical protein
MKIKTHYKFFFLLAASIALVSAGCKKDEAITSEVPTIELESVSSSSVLEGDPITFRVKYTDGDGDLGENNPDAHNLFLTDNRVNVTYEYRIQELAPSGSTLIIRGHLNVELNSTAITDGSNSQSVTYSIHVVDRAGHQSNTVTSSAITIHK